MIYLCDFIRVLFIVECLKLTATNFLTIFIFRASLNQGLIDYVPPERAIARETRARIVRALSTGSVSELNRPPMGARGHRHCEKHARVLDDFEREQSRGRYPTPSKEFNFERDEFLMPVDEVIAQR